MSIDAALAERTGERAAGRIDAGALVAPLESLDRTRIAVAGGKAANLGELIRAGFPVPAGFCVTTAAYSLAAQGSAVGEVVRELVGVPASEVARLEGLAARARAAMLEAPIPEPAARAIAAAYQALGGGPVAVRSSATAEDLPDASFAGQQDTYLGVRGQEGLLEAVRRCWASLWTDRAVAYRARERIDPRSVELAVVVQRMTDAAVAGVLFTANPLTGTRGRAVIDASPGLGEAVVSGAVNPDHFEVDARSGAVVARRIGDKRVAVEMTEGGGTRRVEREDASGAACLSDEEVLSLARLGERVERHYGAPQDVEWAFDGERTLWLLQARPITTLFPLPEAAPPADVELRAYLNFNVAQGVLRPLTPLGSELLRRFVGSVAAVSGYPPEDASKGPPLLDEAAGRLLIELTPFVRSDIGRRVLRFVFPRMEARSAAALGTLLEDPRLAPRPVSKWRLGRAVLGVMARTRAPVTIAKALLRPEDAPARCERAGEEALAAGEAPPGARGEALLDATL
ncbi:MAG: phosphoenolpyruvate synthase, partial [Polyangiaceae bacterium]|nr:phosphoenolpyruvate synthase [Polyangiaceae bacterium]